MIVYRYEMPDGGGPFFTLGGIQRRTGVQMPPSAYVFGCTNFEDINKYFQGKDSIPKECKLVKREIPDQYVVRISDQAMFPKTFIEEGNLLNG